MSKKRGGLLHSHIGKVEKGSVCVGETAVFTIDTARRNRIRANHSATHLVHKALRTVLGEHVAQKGSLVADDRFRFDFSNPKAVTRTELDEVERMVNAVIRQNEPVETRIMPYDDAVAAGAIALFGEKYDDDVRVLTMGLDLDDAGKSYSVELCGGVHVSRTGDIALFKVISESAVAAGISRIEALTGEAARLYLEQQASLARAAAEKIKVSLPELPARLEALVADRKKLERDLSNAKKTLAMGGEAGASANGTDDARDIAGVKYVGRVAGRCCGKRPPRSD